MFDIGWTELLILAVVAVIIVGPKDLPRMLRSLGRYAGKMRRMAGEFRDQFDDALRESELDDLRSSWKETSGMNPLNQVKDSVSESMNPLKDTAEDIKGGIEKGASSGTQGKMDTSARNTAAGKGGTSASKTAPAGTGGGKAAKGAGSKTGAAGGGKSGRKSPGGSKTSGKAASKSKAKAGGAAAKSGG